MKKFLCLILSLLMVAAAIPAGAATLTLPSDLTAIADEAFMNDTSLTDVVIADGTTTIGARAFAGCTNLSKVTIPDSVTAIADDAFDGCDLDKLRFDCSGSCYADTYATENGIEFFRKYRALLVAQQYTNSTVSSLNGPGNDIIAMLKALEQFPGTPYAYKRIVDKTAAEILTNISTTFAGAGDHDVSLFYYSGHGFGPEGYWYTGALVGTDNKPVSALALRLKLDEIRGKKIIIIDACYSGHLIGKTVDGTAKAIGPAEEAAAAADFVTGFNNSFISAFSSAARSSEDLADNNYYVITAANGYQPSLEVTFTETGKAVGLFTMALTEGMGWDEGTNTAYSKAYADTNSDGRISLNEGYTYAARVSNEIAVQIGASSPQQAQVYPTNCNDFYIVAK